MSISRTQQFFESLWYREKPWWLWLFMPFHWLLSLLVWLRRKLYQLGVFKSYQADVPVVVIGNINVGGTGKTPFAIYFINKLVDQGYKPGLVTRGYGGKTDQHPFIISKESDPAITGDEPVLIAKHTQAPIVVDYERARGAKKLIKEFNCNLVICDDGLQHYALQRDIEILIIDASRQFGNEMLMPFGPLREPVSRAKQTHITVINGQDMQLEADAIRRLIDNKTVKTTDIEKPITAIAAIGNPQRFYRTLELLGLDFETHDFPDHHKFKYDDFAQLEGNLIMTEKDAVKCCFLDEDRYYYLPVTAKIDDNIEQELLNLIEQTVQAKAHES